MITETRFGLTMALILMKYEVMRGSGHADITQ
jgi:hypothetical protein